MAKTIKLQTPLRSEDLVDLEIGDKILLSGTIYAARDAAHRKLSLLLEKNLALPISLQGQVIYYVGPTPAKPGQVIGSAGPTTSYRMDKYSPALLDRGLKAMIGKGVRSSQVKKAIIKNQAIYLIAVGGVGVLLAQCIKASKIIAWEELGAEALREFQVEDFPCFVGIDTKGRDLYEEGIKPYQTIAEDLNEAS